MRKDSGNFWTWSATPDCGQGQAHNVEHTDIWGQDGAEIHVADVRRNTHWHAEISIGVKIFRSRTMALDHRWLAKMFTREWGLEVWRSVHDLIRILNQIVSFWRPMSIHKGGEKLIEKFERYWLSLAMAILRFRATKYLSVGFMKDEDGCMAHGLAKSPKQCKQLIWVAQTFGRMLVASQELDRAGLDSDGDEWAPDENMELMSSSSDENFSKQNKMEYLLLAQSINAMYLYFTTRMCKIMYMMICGNGCYIKTALSNMHKSREIWICRSVNEQMDLVCVQNWTKAHLQCNV